MLVLEALDEPGDPGRVELAGQLDRDAPALAAVADVGDAAPLGLAVDARREVLAHLRVEALERVEVGLARADPAEAHVVVLGPREQKAGRGEEAGERRHDRRRVPSSAASAAAWTGPDPP